MVEANPRVLKAQETGKYEKRLRYSFAKVPEIMEMPSLIDLQRRSYEEFLQRDIPPRLRKKKGLQAALLSLFPVQDFSGRAQLDFEGYKLEDPKYDIEESKYKGLTYASPLRVKLKLVVYDTERDDRAIKRVQEQEVYLGDIPLMTENGTFVINGVERVVVSQMHRSPGVFFDHDRSAGATVGKKFMVLARVIPSYGSWLDFEFDAKDLLYVRIDRKRKFLATTLLMALVDTMDEVEKDSARDKDRRKDKVAPNPVGMSREEILAAFYKTITLERQENGWKLPFIDAHWRGTRLDEDLIDAETGNVAAAKGTKLNRRALTKMHQEGVKFLCVSNPYLRGKFVAVDLVDQKTGEIYADAGAEITDALLATLDEKGIDHLPILDIDNETGAYLRNTLEADKNMTRQDALFEIYRILRPGETPTMEGAESLFYNLFFNRDRYDLSDVGRVKINACLGLDTPPDVRVLQKRDIIMIIKFLLDLKDGRGSIDDVDSLSNRRVRSVGELLEGQYRAGLSRVQRNISERMSSVDLETTAMPNDLMNVRPLSAVIREFFGLSQLSQFMDQTNPLSEVNHKRRLSALGPGGVTRERAGIEIRDVHPSHYGRVCPVETPEGSNIGLINSMAIYARVNQYGFLETPYRRVVDGCLTDEIIYVSSMEEEKYVIAQADLALDADRRITDEVVGCRHKGNYVFVPPSQIDFADVSPKQILSVAAALIPFIENNDVSRALMGSNMQRQAVPLIRAEAPVVGTGIEGVVARDSGIVVLAKRAGIVDHVEAKRIVVRATEHLEKGASVVDIYNLAKFQKSNSGTCIHQKPLVQVGQKVVAGEVIADGTATDLGELALGRNVLVAFMPWNGFGFEDSIVLSQKLLDEDVYTSIHIEEFEVSARDMRQGYEEITRDIPGASEESLRHLDETGIAYIGAEVRSGDILVGKVSPKTETPVTPEEKLLRAIFADKASDVRDTSLKVPPGVAGTVVDVRIFSRRGVEKDERALSIDRSEMMRLVQERDVESRILEKGLEKAIRHLVVDKISVKGIGKTGKSGILNSEKWETLTRHQRLNVAVEDEAVQEQLDALRQQHRNAVKEIQKRFEEKVEKIHRGDELPTGVLKTVKVFLAVKRKVQAGDKMSGRHGNKGVVSTIVPVEDMPYLADGTPVDIILNPLGLPSRMNVGQILETHLGWASRNLGRQIRELLEDIAREGLDESKGTKKLQEGLKNVYKRADLNKRIDRMDSEELVTLADQVVRGLPMACPVFQGARIKDIGHALERAGCNPSGQEILFDGRTGMPFDRAVTVGVIYMLKLHHLVDEKIHARSTGPYSLVTQQPLGGKAQGGGQRLGEMEVWALEAYGASYILQEMLTVKSDDVVGRARVYEALIKGQETFGTGVPESFNVLVKELRTLGLNMECHKDDFIAVENEEHAQEQSDAQSTSASTASQ